MNTKQYGGTISPTFLQEMRAKGMADDDIAEAMAQSSPTLRAQLDRIRTATKNDPRATSAFLNVRFYGDANYTPEPSESKGYIGRTLDRIYGAAMDVAENAEQNRQMKITPGQAAIRSIADSTRMILSPATEGISTVAGGLMKATGADQVIQGAAQEFVQSDLGQAVMPVAKGVADKYNALPEGSGWRDLGAIGKAAVDVADVYGVGMGANIGKNVVKGVAKATAGAVRHPIKTAKGVIGRSATLADDAVGAVDDLPLAGKAEEAVKAGMDEKGVRFILDRTPEEKSIMKQMAAEAERGSKLLGGTTRHKELVGQQLLRNAQYVIDQRKRVGEALGNISSAMADESVDLTGAAHRLFTQMGDKGVVFSRDTGKIISAAGYTDAEIPLLQKLADFFQFDDQGKVVKTFKDADMFRQKYFRELDGAKASVQPTKEGRSVFDAAERIANDARSLLLQEMGNLNPNYRTLATAYAELSNKPSSFYKLIGYKGKLDDISAADLGTGEKAMRILGNASANPKEAIQELITVARKYGFESNIDEMRLILWADELENLFPITPTRSLEGHAKRAGRDVVEGSIKSGPIEDLYGRAKEEVIELYRWARGMTPENRLKLLNELLDAPPETTFKEIAEEALPDQFLETLDDAVEEGMKASDAAPIVKETLKTTPKE